MYTRFFGLNEKPFSITPDPRYLFMSERHGEALAHLVYGVTESGGFIQLTGEVGTGKTTLVRSLLQNRMPGNADVAVVLNPQLSAHEFLATICEELGIDVPNESDSSKALTDALNRHLLGAHSDSRRTILVVDEAQNLAPAVLEQVRLLTNLETAKQKLLQIILIGQPELRELLARNDLRQLAQRITGRYHLEPLSNFETAQYIDHRLRVAGALGEIFDKGAKKEVYRLSEGVPRLINVICDRALLGAYAKETRHINKRLVRRAATEVSGELQLRPWWPPVAAAVALVGIAIATAITTGYWPSSPLQDDEQPSSTIAEPETVAIASTALSAAPASENDTALAAEPLPSLQEQLALAGELTNSEFAFAALFDLWKLEYRRGERNACLQAADAGLACLSRRGSFSNLQQLDRPAILSVVDGNGDTHNVVLIAVHGNEVDLSIGGVVVTQPIKSITDLWLGQSLLLWRPPVDVAVSLARGASGPEVIWLRSSLAKIDASYASGGADNDQYDAALEDAVRRFQKDHRLSIDGLAGRQTQIIINSRLSSDDTPRLSAMLQAEN